MKNLFLAAGVAALAISAPAVADPGKNDRGKGRDRGAVKAERGGGGGERAKKAQERRSQSANKSREQRFERGKKAKEQRAKFANKANERRSEQFKKDREQSFKQAEKAQKRRVEQANKFAKRDRDDSRSNDFDRDRFERRFAERGFPAGFVRDCPPGLRVGDGMCMPPGQYKKLGQRLPAQYRGHVLPAQLRDLYRDTDDYYYRFGNGYLYKVDRDEQLIRSVLPLIGAGLGIGMPFPYTSASYRVPSAYQPFYPNTADDYYRYANGYVYEIDRSSGMIEDMIPLLDQGYGVGQMLPAGYSSYNLPYQYRSHYQDNDDYLYRYAPGAIYQVDRESQLITAVASLLTGSSNGLAVGQPLPMGYDAYNVPFAYRDRYYDTPESMYRYSNGNIYQVDPTTRLITAIVDAIV